jgi:hypothetical protein
VIFWGAWIKMALGYLGLILFGLVFDYARIHMVLTGGRKVRTSLGYALRFTANHLASTFALAFLLLCAGWLVLGVYNLISGALSAPSWIVVIALLILQQLYILFRMSLRLTAYSSQMHLYRSLSE